MGYLCNFVSYCISLLLLIAGFFEDAASHASNEFQKLATAFSDDYRFAHSSNAGVLDKYGYKE